MARKYQDALVGFCWIDNFIFIALQAWSQFLVTYGLCIAILTVNSAILADYSAHHVDNTRTEIVAFSLFIFLYLVQQKAQELREKSHVEDSWVLRLNINLLGYCCILAPGYLLLRFIKASEYSERSSVGLCSKILHLCLSEPEPDLLKPSDSSSSPSQSRSSTKLALQLILCFVGLQGSYLIWGILQEKIMTREYQNSQEEKAFFKDSQFLVFVNRVLAFSLSGLYILFTVQPRHNCPLYKYVYCSLTNILSSWCQYEALKFVSFPTQVLVKASKIIPVMLMGRIVSKKKFEYFEYVTAILLSAGMVIFLFDNGEEKKGVSQTTVSGIILMAMYMTMDSFTSNWQDKLFSSYKISSIQMMCFVNFFSCLLTVVSLASQGMFLSSFHFMTKFPAFALDCVILSICSATGQLFIFHTIATFGPVVFVIITTLRQVFAILLSCVIYQHHLSIVGVFGVIIVFFAIFLRIYCNQRLRKIKKQQLRSSTQG